jgi:thioredoxin reductase
MTDELIGTVVRDMVSRIRGENPLEVLHSEGAKILYTDLKRICDAAGFASQEADLRRSAAIWSRAVSYCSTNEEAVVVLSKFLENLLS